MAKPLGPKSLVIRQAITAHSDKGNKDIAELINDSQDRLDDKIKVTPQEVAMQKQAMKKVGAATAAPAPTPAAPAEKATSKPGNGRRKGGRKPGRKPAAVAQGAVPTKAVGNPVEAAREVKELVQKYGAETVKGLADLFGK